MIELLKIHALVIVARVLVFVGAVAEEISLACRRRAGRILDEATAWLETGDAVNRRGWLIFEEKGGALMRRQGPEPDTLRACKGSLKRFMTSVRNRTWIAVSYRFPPKAGSAKPVWVFQIFSEMEYFAA